MFRKTRIASSLVTLPNERSSKNRNFVFWKFKKMIWLSSYPNFFKNDAILPSLPLRKWLQKIVDSKAYNPKSFVYAQMNRWFIWNRMVFISNPYDLAIRSYSFFSTDTQKQTKWLLTQSWHSITNGHIMASLFLIRSWNMAQKIRYAIANWFIYVHCE